MFIHNKIKIKNKIFYKYEKYVKMKQIKKNQKNRAQQNCG